MYGPQVAILLMYRSHDMRRIDFPQVDGQRDPRVWGVTTLTNNIGIFFILATMLIIRFVV